MSFSTVEGIKKYYDLLHIHSLVERDVEMIKVTGNVLTIERASDNKLFIAQIKKNIYDTNNI